MGQVPRELTPLESALDFFGAQLRHWRTVRGLSQAELGRRTHDSGALIGKIEKRERFPSLALTRRLDAVLDLPCSHPGVTAQRRAAAHAVGDGWPEARSALVMTCRDYGLAVDITAGSDTHPTIA